LQYGHADPGWRRVVRFVGRIRWWTWILLLLIAPSVANLWQNRAVWVRHDPGAPTTRVSAVQPHGIAVSRDERRIAFCDRKRVVVLDSLSGREIFHVPIDAAVVSISHDGRRLVTAAEDRSVCLIDMTDGKELLEIPCQRNRVADSLFSLSDDGSRLVIRGEDGISLWDTASATKLKDLFSDLVTNTFTVTTDQQNQAHFIELPSGRERFAVANVSPRNFQLTPDGQHLLLTDINKLTLVDAATGKVIRAVPSAAGTYWSIPTISPDSRFIASEDPSPLTPWADSTTIFDANTLATVATVPGDVYEGSQPFSKDSKRFVISHDIGSVVILNTGTWKAITELRPGLPMSGFNSGELSWYLSENLIVTSSTVRDPGGSFCYWSKRRPDAWWGVVVLTQFWLALAIALLAASSFVRDICRS
jgi:WD40 repeat protein